MPSAPQAVPSILIALVFLFMSLLKMTKAQYEHAFTRFLIGVWYVVVSVFSIPMDWRVSVGGTLFTIMGIIEVLSFFYRRRIIRQYEEALKPLKEFKKYHD